MKTLVKNLIVLIALMSAVSAHAIEYKWKNEKGGRVYDCGGYFVGGEAVVKELGRGRYRVKGVLINREVQANSIHHAAQIGCGEKEEYEPAPQTTTVPEEK